MWVRVPSGSLLSIFFFLLFPHFNLHPAAVSFECWTLLEQSHSSTSSHGNRLVTALARRKSTDKRGEIGSSTHVSFSPCTVSCYYTYVCTHASRLSEELSQTFCVSVVIYLAHTPDNSFLGFVVGSRERNLSSLTKRNISLIYGKELYMWKVNTKATYCKIVQVHYMYSITCTYLYVTAFSYA